MSWVEVDGTGRRWMEVDGAGWRWVHGLVIPININICIKTGYRKRYVLTAMSSGFRI